VKHRKQIAVGEKVPLELTERERDLASRQGSVLSAVPGAKGQVYTGRPRRIQNESCRECQPAVGST
jgi:hypothetical protein